MKYKVNDILSILENVKKQSNGQYLARCPAHPDKAGDDLSITENENGDAVCNCFAGCKQEDIWNAIYNKLGKPERETQSRPRKLVASYEYKNERGDVIDTKRRYEPKSFSWKVTAAKRKEILPLYHLSDILSNSLIFGVEGEKDADNLQTLGYAATTTKDGFTLENMRYLDGKSLLIIEDNDAAGERIAQKAAALAYGHASSIKVISLASFYSALPPKGDISDYIQANGDLKSLLSYAENLSEFALDINTLEDKEHPHTAIYNQIEHYSINKKGCLVYNGDTATVLCYGSMIISEEIQKNDGNENTIYFKIDAITQDGKHLRPVTIPASEFDSLSWISKEYGSSIVIAPSPSAKQKLIAGVKLSGRQAKRSTVYTHTGYIMQENKPISYIHSRGCINGDLTSELDSNLNQYRLKGISSTADDARNAARMSLRLLDAHSHSVTYPLFAFTYLAPLAPIISETIGESGFCLYLQGKTQSGKSTLAALSLSHFGKFDAMTPPITFNATANYIRELSFYLKDSILWLDDFIPRGTRKDSDKQSGIMQDIARAAGDHAFRGRLTSTAKLAAMHRPRSLFLATGELTPQIGQSGTARLFTLYVEKMRGDIKELKNAARNGLLSQAMSDYISFIITHYDDERELFESIYKECETASINAFEESRLSSQVALLCSAAKMYLDYAKKLNVIDNVNEYAKRFDDHIFKAGENITQELKRQDPATMYIEALRAIVTSGRRFVIDLGKNEQYTQSENLGSRDEVLGWRDHAFYYFEPNVTFKAVCDYWNSENTFFNCQKTQIQRELCDLGIITPDNKNNPCSVKNLGYRTARVLKISRKIIDDLERGDHVD